MNSKYSSTLTYQAKDRNPKQNLNFKNLYIKKQLTSEIGEPDPVTTPTARFKEDSEYSDKPDAE